MVKTYQQGTRTGRRALATAIQIAQQDAVDGVVEGSGRVPLELDPIEIARTRLVVALRLFHHQALQALADRLVKEQCECVSIAHGVARGSPVGVVRPGDRRLS